MVVVQRVELTRLAQCILIDMNVCIDAGAGLLVRLDAFQVHLRQALDGQNVRAHGVVDFRDRGLDQLELHAVPPVTPVVVIVREYRQVEGKEGGGAERQE